MFLKMMKIFLFTFFLFSTWQANAELISCKYGSKNAYNYKYNEKKIWDKANALKQEINRTSELNRRRLLEGVGFPGDPTSIDSVQNLPQEIVEQLEGQLVLYEIYENEKDREQNDQCKFDGETLGSKIRKTIKENCYFEAIEKTCSRVKETILEATCGNKKVNPRPPKSCEHGLAGSETQEEWSQVKGPLTPESIKYWTKRRDDLLAKVKVFRDGTSEEDAWNPEKNFFSGYESCAAKIKNLIDHKKCFNTYGIIFDKDLKQLARNKCTSEAIDAYVNQFIAIMDMEIGPVRLFQRIRNEYAMARLCTIRIVNFAMKLDEGLKEATERLNTAIDPSTSRETTSNGGR